MKPKIDGTTFGSIMISGKEYEHDVLIRLDGKVKKRKKKLSKSIYGTSHIVSPDEAKHVFEKGAKHLIVGTGQSGALGLSDDAAAYFEKHDCSVRLLPTPKAVAAWNS
ncbi:MAG: hypothetical protein GF344_00595, partial [Chitinivibrionales bacterium]|nr:hypothetical protein [Chitinivibrionales bacterium]